ncbi:MAG: L-threonylcarbamoyladenylate synthase [Lactovum sp.]
MKEKEEAIQILKSGDLVILPTETVYGIFADARNQKAVEKLYKVKGRSLDKALNLNVADYETILNYSKSPPDYLKKLVQSFLPGPLTLILKANHKVPDWVNSGKTTVGFRLPSVLISQEIIRELGLLVGPSANLSERVSPLYFSDLSEEILAESKLAIKDDSIQGLDTTILDLTQIPVKILRQGAITKEELLEKVPEIKEIR